MKFSLSITHNWLTNLSSTNVIKLNSPLSLISAEIQQQTLLCKTLSSEYSMRIDEDFVFKSISFCWISQEEKYDIIVLYFDDIMRESFKILKLIIDDNLLNCHLELNWNWSFRNRDEEKLWKSIANCSLEKCNYTMISGFKTFIIN